MFLLDTHALLWYFLGSDELGVNARDIIEKQTSFYSVASLWEIAIKQSIGKLDLKISINELKNAFLNANFLKLQITAGQLDELKNLDDIHKDPFDRLLIAQAIKGNLTIITADEMIQKYSIKTINARH